MAKQTLNFLIDDAYVEELAKALTRYIASDPDAVLSNNVMEGASTISIESWNLVEETIQRNLHQWIYQISTKQALTIPIPVPFYNLLALLIERGVKDHRGTVNFKIDSQPVDVDIAFSTALFGDTGYFSKTMKSYANGDYLKDGKRKRPSLLSARENDLTKKGDPFSTRVQDVDPLNLAFETRDGVFCSLEGFDVDNSSLYQLLPTMQVTGGLSTVSSRLLQLTQKDMFPVGTSHVQKARLAALWITSHVGISCYCVRNVMRYQVNKDLCSEPLRSLLISERLTPYRELPSTILQPPEAATTANMILSTVEVLNPTLLSHDAYKYLNTVSQHSRHLLLPTALTESLRAHVSRFITYNSNVEFTGTMIACPDMEGGSFGDMVNEFGYQPSDQFFMVNVVDSMNRWRQIMELYPSLQPAPAISLDYNRVPITVKYCALVKSHGDDNTGASFDILSSTISANEIVRFLSRVENFETDSKTDLEFRLKVTFGTDSSMKQTAKFVGSLLPTGSEDPVRLENVQADLDVIQELNDRSGPIYRSNPPLLGSYDKKGVYYYFTKFKELQLIHTADKFSSLLHYPYIDNHGLVSRGYSKISKVRVWPALEVSSASVVDSTGKPVTEYGKLLKTLARRGGFGFGSLLGPLLGTAGGAVGDLLGVPGLGDLGGVLGGTIGSLIPF